MGRKSVVKSYNLIDSGDLSTTFTSNVTNTLNLDKASIHISWTGTSPVGVITVEVRNGENDSYYELQFATTIDITGDSGEHQIILNEMPFTDLRLQYVATSGTGTIDAVYTAKTQGA
jgi:hypothetical protein